MAFIHYSFAIASVILFLHGFFPISEVALNLENEPPIYINNISLNREQVYISTYKKSVIIIIDALRLDFVNRNNMPLTSRLVEQNGCFSKVKVEAPTVTLPRIKALTTGSVPQFIDLVLNLDSTEILKDSIVHSANQGDKKVVFYGDDTWLKLFPNKFHRHEGTSSFFVRDFTEVDNNVTRNIHVELENHDWDMMILHYLGLDHIGHVYGPFSPLVPKKLYEMDEIIHKIHDTMLANNGNTLLIVTGDHGMRDSGGHGGSTHAETNVPFLIIGHHCESSSFPQSDIPVNLAVLLGLRIPSTTIGRLQKKLLPFDLQKYLYALHYNTLLLIQKSFLGQDYFELASVHHEQYLKNSDELHAQIAIELYENCSEIISQSLIKTSTEQHLCYIIIALIIIFSMLLILVLQVTTPSTIPTRENLIAHFFLFTIMLISYFFTLDYVLVLVVIIMFIILVLNWHSLKTKLTGSPVPGEKAYVAVKNKFIFHTMQLNSFSCLGRTIYERITLVASRYSVTTLLLISISVIQPLTFISSSFIEEEHQFWYFLYNLIILFCIINNMKAIHVWDIFFLLCLLIAFRILRKMNSTGDMWANQPDISDWLLKEENYHYYNSFFIFELLIVFFTKLIVTRKAGVWVHITHFVILSLIFLYKNSDANVILGRVIWFSILCHFLYFGAYRISSWILISCLLLKPYNIILIPYCIYSSHFLSKYLDDVVNVLFHLWLGNILFFAQGHSNSLASVDISMGYIGLEKYHAILVIAQVLLHTYIFPVLCHILILEKTKLNKYIVWKILFSYRLYVYFVVSIVTFIFRYHLFIWSVFAPKLFIESVHICFLFIEIFFYYTLIALSLLSKILGHMIQNKYHS